MVLVPGQKLTAAALNNITWQVKSGIMTGGDITITTSSVDVPGCSITFTAPVANTLVKVTAVADFVTTNTGDLNYVTCVVDGVTQNNNAKLQGANLRASVVQIWTPTVSAGSHTIKLQVQKIGTTGVQQLGAGHSRIVVEGLGLT